MSKLIVADAGPLIAFGRIDHLFILNELFGSILITETVATECLIDLTKPGALNIHHAVKEKALKIAPDPNISELGHFLDILGKGEATAIKLALDQNLSLLIDDKLGRNMAKKLEIKIIGTAGILLLAKKRKKIKKILPIIDLLKEAQYYLSKELIKILLEEAKE